MRAPLAAGYVYLLATWLAFGQHVPERSEMEPGSVGSLVVRAFDAVGPVVSFAALTFLAYLLGSLIDDAGSALLHRRGHGTKFGFWSLRASTDDEAFAEATDRFQQEAKLRAELALALAVLSVVLVLRVSWYWLLLLLPSLALFAQAFFVFRRVDAAIRSRIDEVRYRRDAEQGDTRAMSNLGVLLQKRQQRVEAEDWYRRAAEQRDTDAMHHLGRLLEDRGDHDEARHWFDQLARVSQ